MEIGFIHLLRFPSGFSAGITEGGYLHCSKDSKTSIKSPNLKFTGIIIGTEIWSLPPGSEKQHIGN